MYVCATIIAFSVYVLIPILSNDPTDPRYSLIRIPILTCHSLQHLMEKWVELLLDEFFAEGDDEKAMGLDVGAMNDREKVVIPKAQVGFINFIIKPLWTMWRDFAAPSDDIAQLRNMRTNLYVCQSG